MLKKLLFANLLAFLTCFVALDSLFGVVSVRGERITVPDFCGMTEEELSADDRFAVTAEYRYDESPAGTILSQEPPAGSIRKIGEDQTKCALRVVVSMGQKTVTVPDLIGQNAKVAAAELRQLGLLVEEITDRRFSALDYAVGEVLAPSPPAGSVLQVGERVELTVWEGFSED